MEVNLFKECLDFAPSTSVVNVSNVCICVIALSALYFFVRLSQTNMLLKKERQSVKILNKELLKEKEINEKNLLLIKELFLRLSVDFPKIEMS